jgi:hypothetical protein
LVDAPRRPRATPETAIMQTAGVIDSLVMVVVNIALPSLRC